MTRYEYLYRIAEILAPQQSNEFFDYLLHAHDDNGGFLRTRYCYWEKTLSDSNCNHQVKCALVTLRYKYDFNNLPEFYDDSGHTNIKLQIHFGEYYDADLYMELAWANAVGFPYSAVIDMENGSYTILEFAHKKRHHYKVGQPKYCLGESVRFRLLCNNGLYKNKEGTIRIVDSLGTIEQQLEPSYDIEIVENNGTCLCKHIRESDVLCRNRPKCSKNDI